MDCADKALAQGAVLTARQCLADAARLKASLPRALAPGEEASLDRQFIPARLSDNPRLLSRDPNYVARLHQAGSAMLVRAWLEGDWTIAQGAFFDGWSNRNVIRPLRSRRGGPGSDRWTRAPPRRSRWAGGLR